MAGIIVPELAVPKTAMEWTARRSEIVSTLHTLLGALPPLFQPEVEILSRERHDGYSCERFQFHNDDPLGGIACEVPGLLLIPDGLTAPAPAVQYLHWHGGQNGLGKGQALTENSRGTMIAREFLSQGYVVMAIDTYEFGERSGTGPGGPSERGGAEEMSLCKLNLWYGRTLWGMMLRDERLALNYLCSRPEVDAARVAAAGISMGCTRAWWLMALDERIAAGVGVACATRYQNLIAHGSLAAHGIYYFVPGMLQHFDSEAVIACCAPRPLLLLSGDQDAGAPADGVLAIDAAVSPIYDIMDASDRYRSLLYEGVGHEWTPQMWEETMSWLARWLARML